MMRRFAGLTVVFVVCFFAVRGYSQGGPPGNPGDSPDENQTEDPVPDEEEFQYVDPNSAGATPTKFTIQNKRICLDLTKPPINDKCPLRQQVACPAGACWVNKPHCTVVGVAGGIGPQTGMEITGVQQHNFLNRPNVGAGGTGKVPTETDRKLCYKYRFCICNPANGFIGDCEPIDEWRERVLIKWEPTPNVACSIAPRGQ